MFSNDFLKFIKPLLEPIEYDILTQYTKISKKGIRVKHKYRNKVQTEFNLTYRQKTKTLKQLERKLKPLLFLYYLELNAGLF